VSATSPCQVFHRTIEAVWRIESARVIAGLTRDLDLAEDLAQKALLAALELLDRGIVNSDRMSLPIQLT
jgi:predicted RNA polymerase sigma factor